MILFGRPRPPIAGTVRTVMGVRGEPSTPEDPAAGLVWSAIVAQIDRPGSESAFVSVADVPRARFARHPWSLGGGGAAELKELIDKAGASAAGGMTLLAAGSGSAALGAGVAVAAGGTALPVAGSGSAALGGAGGAVTAGGTTLGVLADSIGITAFTLEDDGYLLPADAARRHDLPAEHVREMVVGDAIRDWNQDAREFAVFPYDADLRLLPDDPGHPLLDYLWPARTNLSNSRMFGDKTKIQAGLGWYEYGRLTTDKLKTPLSITFAEVATHNHFVLDRGGKVFKQTAPVIKLPANATEDDHLGLVGLLNSSTACFWLKQVCHNKGSSVDSRGARQRTAPFEDFYAHDGTKLKQFPVPAERPLAFARALDALARERADLLPAAHAARGVPTADALRDARALAGAIRERMIALQEELDWRCYRLYGVTGDDLCPPAGRAGGPSGAAAATSAGAGREVPDVPAVRLGERAFEIVLARKCAAGKWRRSGSSATARRRSPPSRTAGRRRTAPWSSAASRRSKRSPPSP